MTASSNPQVQALLAEISAEFPSFKVVAKPDSWLMKAINVALIALTLGMQRAFMTGFITTIGYTVYIPTGWIDSDPLGFTVTLRHERVHMRQRAKYGMFLFSVLYLLAPLPVGLAYFRAKFEREAYLETMNAWAQLSPDPDSVSQLVPGIVSYFVGPSYLWAWPFRKTVTGWFQAAAASAASAAKAERAIKTP